MTSWNDETEWFYFSGGKENVGPFSTKEMAEYHKDGAVDDDTWIWNESMEGWKQLKDYEEFSSYLDGLSYMSSQNEPKAPESKDTVAALPAAPTEEKKKSSKAKARRTSMLRPTQTKSGQAPPPSSQKSDFSKLKELSEKSYYEQAQWFLNAYWNTEPMNFGNNAEAREKVWEYARLIAKLDLKKGKDGNELDEFQAHVFLEKTGRVMTVKKMRAILKEVDVDFNKKVSLTEFFIFHYTLDYHVLVNAVIGGDEETNSKIEAAKQALADAQVQAEQSAQAAQAAEEDAAAGQTAEDAKKKEEEAVSSPQRAAESEAEAIEKEAAARPKDAATAAREAANEQAEKLQKLDRLQRTLQRRQGAQQKQAKTQQTKVMSNLRPRKRLRRLPRRRKQRLSRKKKCAPKQKKNWRR